MASSMASTRRELVGVAWRREANSASFLGCKCRALSRGTRAAFALAPSSRALSFATLPRATLSTAQALLHSSDTLSRALHCLPAAFKRSGPVSKRAGSRVKWVS